MVELFLIELSAQVLGQLIFKMLTDAMNEKN